MAKGKSTRGSAIGSPSSLTKLLALNKPSAMPPSLQNQTFHQINQQLSEAEYVREQSNRRQFHPLRNLRPPGASVRSAGRLVSYTPPWNPIGESVDPRIAFNVPKRVSICVRRKIRREVLHALQRTARRGSGGTRKRNIYSGIKC